MFPKYPFIIHFSIVQRHGVNSALTFTGLRASVCAARRALETVSCSPLWLQPKASPTAMRSVPRRELHSGIPWHSTQEVALLPPSNSHPLLCSKTKANNGHLLSPGGDKQRKSRKLAFENSAIELTATPRTWPESTFCQPQEAIVLVFKQLTAWKETTKWEGNCLPKES